MDTQNRQVDTIPQFKEQKPITRGEITAYGVGGMGANILTMLINTYALYFMTDVAGLSVSVAGLIVSLSIIFDAVTDPLVAFLEDKTSGRFGRYHPYLIIGSPISAVATVMLFFKIPAEGNAAAVYYLCVYCLYKLGYTMTSMARHGLTATLSSDRATRNTIVTVGKLFATPVGLLLSFAHQIVKQAGEGNEAQGWFMMTALCGVIMVATMWISSHAARRFDNAEISATTSRNEKGEKLRVSDILRAVKGNKALFCLMLAYSTNAFADKFVSSNQQYYAKYYLENMKFISLTGTISTILTVPMFLLVLWLSRRIPKCKIFLYATILHLVFPVLLLCGFSHNFYVMVVSMALSKITALTCTMCMQIMMPDCVDYGYQISGVVAAGAVASVLTFTDKLVQALGSTVSTAVLDAAGYVPNVAQPAEVLTAIILLLAIPTIFSDVCSIIGMRLYPIKSVDKKKKN